MAVTFTVSQIARAVGCNRQTILRRIDDGRLKADLAVGAYQVTGDAVREWLTAEGYGPENVEQIMRDLTTAAMTARGKPKRLGAGVDTAHAMGRIYALLVQCGAETLDHVAAASVAPGHALGRLAAKAVQSPGYSAVERDLSALMRQLDPAAVTGDAWTEEAQGRFWIGFYFQQGVGGEQQAAPMVCHTSEQGDGGAADGQPAPKPTGRHVHRH